MIYDLPVVQFPAPQFWRDFPAEQHDALGSRWIAHQHFPPFESIVEWAQDRGVFLITTTRHPADTLVSLLHYVRNFARRIPIDQETVELLCPADSPAKDEDFLQSMRGLERYVSEKFFKSLHFSIAWLQRDLSFGVRYEDLWNAPGDTLRTLTEQVRPVSPRAVAKAVNESGLLTMRGNAGQDASFFRGGGIANWKATLPPKIVEMLGGLPPYRSQFEWLGYTLDLPELESRPSVEMPRYPPPAKILPFVPIDFMSKADTSEIDYEWLNSPSEQDSLPSQIPPVITNLGKYLYDRRPDLQRAFPDIYGSSRVAFSHWFTEINFVGAEALDPYFVVPVYESWLSSCRPSFTPVHCPQRTFTPPA
jgi:Sulfotransferase domain